jgi:hypothetical protein
MVSKNVGTEISIPEVETILTEFGAIEEVFRPSKSEAELFGLPRSGQFFRFAFFQDCLDAAAVGSCLTLGENVADLGRPFAITLSIASSNEVSLRSRSPHVAAIV